jgi:hypothetical protein
MRVRLSTGDGVGVPVMAFARSVAIIALGAIVTTSSAMADSLSLNNPGKTDKAPIALDPNIPLAKGTDTKQSPADLDAETSDLETSRAAIDRRAGPAITLGVSGWVGEQVMATHR